MGKPSAQITVWSRWTTWKREHILLAAILALALIVRVGWLWFMRHTGLVFDEAEYLQIARSIRQGRYLDDFLWVRAPLFPLWLALTSGSLENLLIARLVQTVLGTIFVYQVYRIAFVVWSDYRVAKLGAGIAAIYLPLVAYSRYLMAEMLLLVLLSALLLVLLRITQQATVRQVALAGVLFGLSALTKPVALLCVPALLVAIWMGSGTWQQRAAYSSLALLCGALVVAPWSLRTSLHHGHPILIDTTGGYNLWFGNIQLEHDPMFELNTINAYPDLAAREQAFAARAQDNILNNPGAALRGVGDKLVRFWRLNVDVLATRAFGELPVQCATPLPAQNHGILSPDDIAGHKQARFCSRLWVNGAADIVYLPLLFGLVVSLFRPFPRRFAGIAGAWLVALYLATSLTVVQPRLRLPLMPVLIPWSAAGWLYLLYMLRQNRVSTWRSLSQHWNVYAALIIVVAGMWALRVPALLGSQFYQMQGDAAWERGDSVEALDHFRAAAHWYPARMSALIAAGQTAEALDADSEALQWYDAATSRISYEPLPRIGAARILLHHGEPAAAAEELDSTLMGIARSEAWAFTADILPARTFIDLGNPSVAIHYGYLIGFYVQEDPATSATAFRPSGATAALRFGTQPTPPAIFHMHVSGARPSGAPDPWMALTLHDMPLAHIPVARTWRTYSILVPTTESGVQLVFQTNPFIPAEYVPASQDTRPYGLAISWARLDTDVVDVTQSFQSSLHTMRMHEPDDGLVHRHTRRLHLP